MIPIPISTAFAVVKSKVNVVLVLSIVIIALSVFSYVQHKTISHQTYQITVKDGKITELKDLNAQYRLATAVFEESNKKLSDNILKQNAELAKIAINQQQAIASHNKEMSVLNKKYKDEIDRILGSIPTPVDFNCTTDEAKAIDAIQAIEFILKEEK